MIIFCKSFEDFRAHPPTNVTGARPSNEHVHCAAMMISNTAGYKLSFAVRTPTHSKCHLGIDVSNFVNEQFSRKLWSNGCRNCCPESTSHFLSTSFSSHFTVDRNSVQLYRGKWDYLYRTIPQRERESDRNQQFDEKFMAMCHVV